MSTIMIYMTAASADEASKIAQHLVEQRLVACANIMPPHSSVYRWEGQIERSEEVAVIFKTTGDLFEKTKEAILSLHSYDCPCIMVLPVEQGHQPFLDWIKNEVTG